MKEILECLNQAPALQENEISSDLFTRCVNAVDFILQNWYAEINGMWLLGRPSPEGNVRIITLSFMERESYEGILRSLQFTVGLNQIFNECDIYDYHQHIENRGIFRNDNEKKQLISEIQSGDLRTLYKEGETII